MYVPICEEWVVQFQTRSSFVVITSSIDWKNQNSVE